MFDSKGSYSVKLSKVVEKFNLENLTPEINIKKIIIRQTDINRPALQLQVFLNILILTGYRLSARWSTHTWNGDMSEDHGASMIEKVFQAGIPCPDTAGISGPQRRLWRWVINTVSLCFAQTGEYVVYFRTDTVSVY